MNYTLSRPLSARMARAFDFTIKTAYSANVFSASIVQVMLWNYMIISKEWLRSYILLSLL